MRFWLFALALATTATQVPTITLYPRAVMAGNAMRLTCRIDPTEKTRTVSFGITNLRSSGRQVDGADGIRTYEFLVERMPCKVGPAFCSTTDNTGHQEMTTLPFEIVGCEP